MAFKRGTLARDLILVNFQGVTAAPWGVGRGALRPHKRWEAGWPQLFPNAAFTKARVALVSEARIEAWCLAV
jgi:hypothetical protein